MNKISLIREAAEKAAYEENIRAKELICRAEKLLIGVILVAAFHLLNVPELLESSSPWTKPLCYLALGFLSLSMFLGLYGARLKTYTAYPRGDKLWDNLKPDEVSRETAEQAIIQLLLKAREQNAKLSDAKEKVLSVCRWLFFAGFLLVVTGRLLAGLANLYAQ
ncbi:MAG TPA: hypothetical protein VMH87_16970 [Pseudomonadales bacterium]|nr:hypothetical protein [Pseudomonadales bacterium]